MTPAPLEHSSVGGALNFTREGTSETQRLIISRQIGCAVR
jgi:hypothetical protein